MSNVDLASNIIVGHAKVSCSCAQLKRAKSKNTTRLRVEENENGSNTSGNYIIATEKDCIAGVNLVPFQRCYAPDYMEAAKTYTQKMRNSGDVYRKLASDYSDRGYGTCLHLLEEVWFHTNEKTVVSAMYNMEERLLKNKTLYSNEEGDIPIITQELKILIQKIKPLIKEKSGTGYCDDAIVNMRYRQRDTALKEITDKILNEWLPTVKEYATRFGYAEAYTFKSYEFKQNYMEVRNNVIKIQTSLRKLINKSTWEIGKINTSIGVAMPSNALRPNVVSPERTAEMIVKDIEALECYQKIDNMLIELRKDLNEVIQNITDWTTECSNTLTFDSFMVCRCGGVLEFVTSGQEYVQYFDKIYSRMIEHLQEYAARLQSLAESQVYFCLEGLEVDSEERDLLYAYEDAADGLEKAYKYLSTEEIEQEPMRCNVHIEFVARSVQEESEQYITGIITLIGLIPHPATVPFKIASAAMGVYYMNENRKQEKLLTFENGKTTFEIGLTASSITADVLQSAQKATPTALGYVNSVGNVYSFIAAMSCANFEITDNWLERIRIYIFTEGYMFLGEMYLNESGEKSRESGCWPGVAKKQYMNMDYVISRGRNLEWGEHPGITFDVQTRAGEKPGTEYIENVDSFVNIFGEDKVYE